MNPLPVLQIPTGIGMLLGGLALGAFVALVVGFIAYRREEATPEIDVAGAGSEADAKATADKPSRPRVSA